MYLGYPYDYKPCDEKSFDSSVQPMPYTELLKQILELQKKQNDQPRKFDYE